LLTFQFCTSKKFAAVVHSVLTGQHVVKMADQRLTVKITSTITVTFLTDTYFPPAELE